MSLRDHTKKHCCDCKYCIHQDYGYSNWTVEGTEIDCLRKLNPKFPVDRFYGECPEGEFADECRWYEAGDGPCIDVDRSYAPLENYSNDEDVKAFLRLW